MESDSDYEEASEDPFEGQFLIFASISTGILSWIPETASRTLESKKSNHFSIKMSFLLQYYSLQRYANH